MGCSTGCNATGMCTPFLCALALFVLGFIGIGISFYPYIVPSSLTIVEAAAPDSSLKFALVGTLVLLPMILAYTALRLLGVPRKDRPRRGLPLMRRNWMTRTGWFVLIWVLSVAALGLVAYGIRLMIMP